MPLLAESVPLLETFPGTLSVVLLTILDWGNCPQGAVLGKTVLNLLWWGWRLQGGCNESSMLTDTLLSKLLWSQNPSDIIQNIWCTQLSWHFKFSKWGIFSLISNKNHTYLNSLCFSSFSRFLPPILLPHLQTWIPGLIFDKDSSGKNFSFNNFLKLL